MRGATVVPFQPHQILRLSRRKTHMLNPHHIWNLIYNARSNSCPPPTSPNTVPVTQKDSHAESSSHMKPDLQCAEQQVSPSNLTKYCACHAARLTCWILITYETSFTVGEATVVPLQPHQILRLSRRKTHMLNPHHIWNLIYSARSNRCPPPTSPNTAPVTQKDSHAESSSHMKPDLQCAGQQLSLQRHQILCLSRRKTHMLNPHHIWNLIDSARGNSCPLPHQILRLSRSKTHMLNPHHIWNLIYSGRSNSSPPPTSPNIAPVTQKDSHAESSSHMKPHLHGAEQQVSPSNVTKYCVCHKKIAMQNFWENLWKQMKRHFQCGADLRMIRPWNRQSATRVATEVELSTSIFYCKIQRFAANLTFKPSPSAAPATTSDTWTSPNTTPATKSDTCISPSTAPATKSDTRTSPSIAPATSTSPSIARATKSDTWTSPSIAPAT